MNECQIFQRAINAWGVDFQEEQCVEECAELIVAIKHVKRNSHSASVHERHNAVITEIADVAIMLEQMKLMYGEDNFKTEYERKLKRLEDRLDAKT